MSLVPTLAGTGHRPDKLGGYGDAVLGALFKLAKQELRAIQPAVVVSGMALGWDTALALAAIKLKIPLVAAVPFEGQEERWPAQSQERYRKILAQADVRVISEGGYTPGKMQIRNEWMVDKANVLLALWNGSAGGTANCVRYAQARKIEIVNCWERWIPQKG